MAKPDPTSLKQWTSSQATKQRKAFLFAAIVGCAALNPAQGEKHQANRPLLSDHIEKFFGSSKDDGVRRFDRECYMKVSITPELARQSKAD